MVWAVALSLALTLSTKPAVDELPVVDEVVEVEEVDEVADDIVPTGDDVVEDLDSQLEVVEVPEPDIVEPEPDVKTDEPTVTPTVEESKGPILTYSPDGELLSTTEAPTLSSEPTRATSTPYASVTSNTYSDIASRMLWHLGFGDDYVFWRSGQYSYSFAYGDLDLSGGRFTGSAVTLVTFTLDTGYNGTYVMNRQTTNVDVNAGQYIVFSNLGGYPVLDTNHVGLSLLVFSAFVGLLMALIRSVFGFVLRMGVRNVS